MFLVKKPQLNPMAAKPILVLAFIIIRRLMAALTFIAVIAAGIKAAFEWVAQSGDDDHEVFADDDRETV